MTGDGPRLCPFPENSNTFTPLAPILLENNTLSVEERLEPLLSFSITGKTPHTLARRGKDKEGRATARARDPGLQTSFMKLELTVSLYHRLEMGFSHLFQFFNYWWPFPLSVSVKPSCICPSSQSVHFSDVYLLLFLVCSHQQGSIYELFS